MLTSFIGASFIISSTGSNVIVVGEVIVYVPVLSLGADIVETVIVSANIVPVTLSPSLIVTTVESLELIVFVSIVDAVNGPDTRIPSFTKISELSDDEIALIIGVVVPVTVNTSPLTAVVIFVAPAI